jgi:hypothetical protein
MKISVESNATDGRHNSAKISKALLWGSFSFGSIAVITTLAQLFTVWNEDYFEPVENAREIAFSFDLDEPHKIFGYRSITG